MFILISYLDAISGLKLDSIVHIATRDSFEVSYASTLKLAFYVITVNICRRFDFTTVVAPKPSKAMAVLSAKISGGVDQHRSVSASLSFAKSTPLQ